MIVTDSNINQFNFQVRKMIKNGIKPFHNCSNIFFSFFVIKEIKRAINSKWWRNDSLICEKTVSKFQNFKKNKKRNISHKTRKKHSVQFELDSKVNNGIKPFG